MDIASHTRTWRFFFYCFNLLQIETNNEAMWKERTFRIYTNGACGWHNILCSGANCALWWSKSNNEEDFTAWKKKKCQRHSQNLPNAYLSTITNIATASVCVCVCMCTKPGRKWTDDRLPKYIINQAMSNNEPEIKNLVKTINWVIEIINNPVRLIFCTFSIALCVVTSYHTHYWLDQTHTTQIS